MPPQLADDSIILQANLQSLAVHRPQLFELIKSVAPAGEIFLTPKGLPNMRYYDQGVERSTAACAHGNDPWLESGTHLDTVPPDACGLVVFIGMGLGYAPLLVRRERPQLAMLVIVEPDISMFAAALRALDLQPLISSTQVEFLVGEIDYSYLASKIERLAALEDIHIMRHQESFSHEPRLYGHHNDETYGLLNKINVAGSTIKKCGPDFLKNRLANLSLLRHSYRLGCLRKLFKGKPAVLVAAGPSLNQSLEGLHKVVGRCLLIAVDSALAPLLAAGIVPDFVTTIDYQDLNFEKLAPFMDRDWPFSMVALSNVTPLIPKRFPCRHLFLAMQESLPQMWILEALGIKTLAPDSFSVAHFSHGLAKIMGAEPLIFVGQDLSFTDKDSDHAQGVILHNACLEAEHEIFQIEGLDNTRVQTDRQLMSLLRLLEENIAAGDATCFNASAAGAVIKGTIRGNLDELAARYCNSPLSVQEKLNQAVLKGRFKPDNLLRRIDKTVSLCRDIITRLERLTETGSNLRQKCGTMINAPYQSVHDLPESTRRRLVNFDRTNNEVDDCESFWTHVSELTFSLLAVNDRQRLQNDRVRVEQGYMPWLLVELERINKVNHERLQTVKLYHTRLRHLLQDLRQEARLTAAAGSRPGPETWLALIRHYLEDGKVSIAAQTLAALPAQSGNDARLAAWLIHLLRFNHKAAAADLTDAAGEMIPKNKWASDLQQKELYWWLQHTDKHCGAGAVTPFPTLLRQWLARIATLLNGSPAPAELLELWDTKQSEIRAMLGRNEIDDALAAISLWQPLVDRLPTLAVITAEAQTKKDGNHAALIKKVEDTLATDPENSDLQAAAAMFFIHAGQPDKGVALLVGAVSKSPRHGMLWGELGEELLAAGDLQSAVAAFEKGFMAQPQCHDMLRRMGDCYLELKMPEAAREAYEAVLRKAPDDTQAKDALMRL